MCLVQHTHTTVHRRRILTQKREALFVVTSELAPRRKHVGYISHVCRQTTDNKFPTFNCRIVADARVCSAAELKQRKRLIFQRRLNIYILTMGRATPHPFAALESLHTGGGLNHFFRLAQILGRVSCVLSSLGV